MAVKNTKN